MTADDVRAMLRRACQSAGTARAWATKNRLSEAYVSDVLRGKREPAAAICDALGLEAETIYRKVQK